MKLCFRNISNAFYVKTFPCDATVRDACAFLSKQIKVDQHLIYLIRPKNFFYSNSESIKTVVKENPKCAIFTQFEHSNSFIGCLDSIGHNQAPLFRKNIPISNFQSINNISSEEILFYWKYASTLKNIPDDIQSRINEVAQLGYDIRDCEEALRDADFNVQIAIQILVSQNSGSTNHFNNIDQIYITDDDLYDFSSDLDLDINIDSSYYQTTSKENYLIFSDTSDLFSSSSISMSEEEPKIIDEKDNSQTKVFRRQTIPDSIKSKFHYHLTLRRKPPSKFKKIKK